MAESQNRNTIKASKFLKLKQFWSTSRSSSRKTVSSSGENGNGNANGRAVPSKDKLPVPSSRLQTRHTAPPQVGSMTADDTYYRNLLSDISAEMDKHPIGLLETDTYLPEDQLARLVTENTILQALPGVSPVLKRFIHDKAPKTFVTTVLVMSDPAKCLSAMQAFHVNDFSDNCLPVTKLTASAVRKRNWNEQGAPRDNYRKSQAPEDCFNHPSWDRTSFNNFCKTQWGMIVHRFSKRQFCYWNIEDERRLPFIKTVTKSENKAGGFSDVEHATMLADYQDMIDAEPHSTINVAIKTLTQVEKGYDLKKAFTREAEAHRTFNELENNHLLKAIAAYKHQGKYYLLLEWADGGNLRSFWSLNPEPRLTRNLMMELLLQLRGLVQALDDMHNTSKARSRSESRSRPTSDTRRGVDDFRASKSSVARGSVTTEPEKDDDEPPGHDIPEIVIHDESNAYTPQAQSPTIMVHTVEEENLAPRGAQQTEDVNENWRHGDIKPENILCFLAANSTLGTMKLADFGRAKRHYLLSYRRPDVEIDKWLTAAYQPPDNFIHKGERTQSRLYDVWSLGCVFFESIIWALYGHKFLQDFTTATSNLNQNETPFWKRRGNNGAVVQDSVMRCLSDLLVKDPECNREGLTAMRDLIRLVRDKMLVIELPEKSDLYTFGKRANTTTLLRELDRIVRKGREPNSIYLFSGNDRSALAPLTLDIEAMQGFSRTNSLLVPGVNAGREMSTQQFNRYTHGLSDKWSYEFDEDFAREIIAECEGDFSDSLEPTTTSLCKDCQQIEVDANGPILVKQMIGLGVNPTKCALCTMLYRSAKAMDIAEDSTVSVTRVGGALRLNGKPKPALRLCRSYDPSHGSEIPSPYIPIGLTNLPDALSKPHQTILRNWLSDCDKRHPCVSQTINSYCPKRLLYLTNDADSTRSNVVERASLTESERKKVKYIALSHPWGPQTQSNKHFCSTTANIESRRKRILDKDLPKTFQDAVRVTRKLGISYLWIDSLCILQGDDGDFRDEAEHMQDIFSSAYCVIAASSARAMSSGLLEYGSMVKREDRLSVGLPHQEGSGKPKLNICESPDDFQSDVIEGDLSQRGWVLQERALARRTIYFTQNQTYWECGEAIRCESLSLLNNTEVAFLGDSDFPSYAVKEKNKGAQQYLFTRLYEDYSRLSFSHWTDKPVAISGLEQRLTKTFNDRSGAGIFEKHKGRCLLWIRAKDVDVLTRIPFTTPAGHARSSAGVTEPKSKAPPSWSWMAYVEGISFLDPSGTNRIWREIDLHLTGTATTSWLYAKVDALSLKAKARDFTIDPPIDPSEWDIVYDDPQKLEKHSKKCVIIGSVGEKNDATAARHYILVVSLKDQQLKNGSYERIGAGYISGRCIIGSDDSAQTVQIE